MHDFEPGIADSGLFWTTPVARAAAAAAPGSGRARFRAVDMPVPDFHDFVNAVFGDRTSVPGHASFDVRWSGGGARSKVRDRTFDFAGDYVGGDVSISFSVSDDGAGVVYTSDAAGQQTVSGGVGHERNGVFF